MGTMAGVHQMRAQETETVSAEDNISTKVYTESLPDRRDYLSRLVAARTCTKAQAVEYAIMCAEEVLFIWEESNPEDDRPRKSIEAARAWLAEPTEARGEAAYYAARATARAADAANYAADAAYYAARATTATAAAYATAAAEHSENAAL